MNDDYMELSSHEESVLSLSSMGLTDRQIADAIPSNVASVQDTRNRLMKGTGTRNLDELLAWYRRNRKT